MLLFFWHVNSQESEAFLIWQLWPKAWASAMEIKQRQDPMVVFQIGKLRQSGAFISCSEGRIGPWEYQNILCPLIGLLGMSIQIGKCLRTSISIWKLWPSQDIIAYNI